MRYRIFSCKLFELQLCSKTLRHTTSCILHYFTHLKIFQSVPRHCAALLRARYYLSNLLAHKMKPAGYCCWWYLLIKFDHTIGGNAEISANRAPALGCSVQWDELILAEALASLIVRRKHRRPQPQIPSSRGFALYLYTLCDAIQCTKSYTAVHIMMRSREC